MFWILPGLLLAWAFAMLGAQAVWVSVLLAAVKVLLALLVLLVGAILLRFALNRLPTRR